MDRLTGRTDGRKDNGAARSDHRPPGPRAVGRPDEESGARTSCSRAARRRVGSEGVQPTCQRVESLNDGRLAVIRQAVRT